MGKLTVSINKHVDLLVDEAVRLHDKVNAYEPAFSEDDYWTEYNAIERALRKRLRKLNKAMRRLANP